MKRLGLLLVLALGCRIAPADPARPAATERKILDWRSIDGSLVRLRQARQGLHGHGAGAGVRGAGGESCASSRSTAPPCRTWACASRRSSAHRLTRIVRALGRVDFDETRVTAVNMKFDGWIEKLWVAETGQYVKRGAPLFAVLQPGAVGERGGVPAAPQGPRRPGHTPSVWCTQRETASCNSMYHVRSSTSITSPGEPERHVVITSPTSGYVDPQDRVRGHLRQEGGEPVHPRRPQRAVGDGRRLRARRAVGGGGPGGHGRAGLPAGPARRKRRSTTSTRR